MDASATSSNHPNAVGQGFGQAHATADDITETHSTTATTTQAATSETSVYWQDWDTEVVVVLRKSDSTNARVRTPRHSLFVRSLVV